MSHEEPLRCVFLMNDDFTPMDFVVSVLVQFFDMDFETAKNTMLRIHNEGAGECGFYLREEAERKVAEVLAFAERHGTVCLRNRSAYEGKHDR
jgi:ATP-dependent Clp protease adaptor protein ClpS